ncbi:hypothetical protein BJ138DRAFT_108847 [Hygrophoropsis aurantiaca]|uniref:Uncharacterized protein n=1 Tax=Hygrophoropsis aurantiaca TaxID=72124 RepID=A0ACB8AB42_9AGAM|nr:hypothetical protein BJ138DRAFT_108847 [Hygrophoropsis aurantiaca]
MYFNTTVANFSPLLLYVPQALWSEALPQDPLLSDYATQSYHATSASQGQASVSFSWSGTGVWLYGGYRPTLGAYKVVVDGKVCQYPGFQNGSTSQANYLLHGSRNLTAGTHSIELTNISEDDEQNILDLDYLVFETYTNEDLVPRTVHYSESDIQYISTSPDEDWNSQPDFRVTNAATGVIKLNFTASV